MQHHCFVHHGDFHEQCLRALCLRRRGARTDPLRRVGGTRSDARAAAAPDAAQLDRVPRRAAAAGTALSRDRNGYRRLRRFDACAGRALDRGLGGRCCCAARRLAHRAGACRGPSHRRRHRRRAGRRLPVPCGQAGAVLDTVYRCAISPRARAAAADRRGDAARRRRPPGRALAAAPALLPARSARPAAGLRVRRDEGDRPPRGRPPRRGAATGWKNASAASRSRCS